MTYIHQLAAWPNFTWDNAALAPLLASTRYRQGRLFGRATSLGFDLQAAATLDALTTEVVTSSAIEGEQLATDEVRSSIARGLGLDVGGLVESNRQVDGIVELMLDATRLCNEPLTNERLWGWHAALFPTGYSGIVVIDVGTWRSNDAEPMRVVSGPFGKERVHFEAPTASRVEGEMTTFIEWFNSAFQVDPVLKAGIAHLWFVTVHPLEDGNGRIARAIADLQLARADGSPQRFYSMSSQILATRQDYYRQLEQAQRGDLDITAWLEWFLRCLDQAITTAEGKFTAVLLKANVWSRANQGAINDRQRLVLNRLLDDWVGHLTTSKYAKLAKCSSDTALRDIHELVQRGVLAQNADKGRSVSYRIAEVPEPDADRT